MFFSRESAHQLPSAPHVTAHEVEEGKLQRHLAMVSSRWLPPELPETDAAALSEQRAEVNRCDHGSPSSPVLRVGPRV